MLQGLEFAEQSINNPQLQDFVENDGNYNEADQDRESRKTGRNC